MQDREGGWGLHHPETHRILTSLSLSLSNFNYTQNNNLRYQKGVKKLIYEITSYVKCNEISSGQLALYANALMATCQNIHDYHDLITRMKQKKNYLPMKEVLYLFLSVLLVIVYKKKISNII